jgi:type I restriction enzyme M protein
MSGFLKMADERKVELPKGCDWPKLRDKSGTVLTDHYADLLRTLSKTPGILGEIYTEAQSRFNNPVNLKKLINLVDETEWTSLGVDVKAEASLNFREGLLGREHSVDFFEGRQDVARYERDGLRDEEGSRRDAFAAL